MPSDAQLPVVAAIEMGYGHLRAAWPVAEALGTAVVEVDRPPLAGDRERRLWAQVRRGYEATSRLSQIPVVGGPFRTLLDAITGIPRLHPIRNLSGVTGGALLLERLAARGLGSGLVEHLRARRAPLFTTFYSAAIAADRGGCQGVHCLVTDSDLNRVWVPLAPDATRIRYLAPSRRAARRLVAYGVPPEHVAFTGFPLPHELVGGRDGPVLRRNLAARLVRLDPERALRRACGEELLARAVGPLPAEEEGRPVHVVFAVGGAGAQAGLARSFLTRLGPAISSGRFRLTLAAGTRQDVADRFRAAISAARLGEGDAAGVEVLAAPTFGAYYRAFNALLARADVLWTKPSELTFYAGLGLPLVMSAPVGVHERYNARWIVRSGAGFMQDDPALAADWLGEWLSDGLLAGAALSAFTRLPHDGLYAILDLLGR
jgi:hypothetical protein